MKRKERFTKIIAIGLAGISLLSVFSIGLTAFATEAPNQEIVTEQVTEKPTEAPTEPATEPITEPTTEAPTEPVTQEKVEENITEENNNFNIAGDASINTTAKVKFRLSFDVKNFKAEDFIGKNLGLKITNKKTKEVFNIYANKTYNFETEIILNPGTYKIEPIEEGAYDKIKLDTKEVTIENGDEDIKIVVTKLVKHTRLRKFFKNNTFLLIALIGISIGMIIVKKRNEDLLSPQSR